MKLASSAYIASLGKLWSAWKTSAQRVKGHTMKSSSDSKSSCGLPIVEMKGRHGFVNPDSDFGLQ